MVLKGNLVTQAHRVPLELRDLEVTRETMVLQVHQDNVET